MEHTSREVEAAHRLLEGLLEMEVAPDDTLEALGLDSLTIVEWAFMVEEHFDCRVPDGTFAAFEATTTVATAGQAMLTQRQPNESPAI